MQTREACDALSMNNTAPVEHDDTVCLPNISRAQFCQRVMAICERFEISYDASEDSLYHCVEACAIALFMEEAPHAPYSVLRTFLQARGVVRFRGE